MTHAQMQPIPSKILCVDEHLDSVEAMKMILEFEGYEVGIACTPNDALAAIGKRLHDLYILDMYMPEIDGLGLCRIIRAGNQDVPIIMYGDGINPGCRVGAYLAGANKYLLKPEELDAIVPAIRDLILIRTRPAVFRKSWGSETLISV